MLYDENNLIKSDIKFADNVIALSKDFMKNPKYVSLNLSKIEKKGLEIKKVYEEKGEEKEWWGYPKGVDKSITGHILMYEIIANAINYQYWYGKNNIRPNGSCSTKMYQLLSKEFKENSLSYSGNYYGNERWYYINIINGFIEKIILHRFPNISSRVKHLNEIIDFIEKEGVLVLQNIAACIHIHCKDINDFIKFIITKFPGYAEDLFLKRAFLLPIMLYRRIGWFKKDIKQVLIPADYQIPKVFRSEGLMLYNRKLSYDIKKHILINSGSLKECEIRAASIIIGKKLADIAECSMAEIDSWAWLQRNKYKSPFHLTVTEDY